MEHFKKNYDSFNEILFKKILDGGSLQWEIDRLRGAAKQFIIRAKIATDAEIAMNMHVVVMQLISDDKHREAAATLVREINKIYDVVHDDLFIIAAFENYAKAALLSKRCIVHRLCKPKVLANQQWKRPVHIKTVRSLRYKDEVYFEHKTIGLNELLQPNYARKVGMSENELYALEQCRSMRNSIHFGGVSASGYNIKFFQGLIELNKRIDNSAKQAFKNNMSHKKLEKLGIKYFT